MYFSIFEAYSNIHMTHESTENESQIIIIDLTIILYYICNYRESFYFFIMMLFTFVQLK